MDPMTMTEEKSGGLVKWALVLLPTLLAVSIVGAVWLHWRSETSEELDPGLALAAGAVDDDEARDLLKKLTQYLGPRDWKTPEGRVNMRRAISLIGGTLSPRNFGYRVKSDGEMPLAGERWPVLWADAAGRGDGVVLVAAPYDTENQGIVALMLLAAELREVGLQKTIRFVFFPSHLWEVTGTPNLTFLDGGVDLVLCLNRFQAGPGRDLWLVGPDWGEAGRAIREIVDFHETDPLLLRTGEKFESVAGRVCEIRGTREPWSAGDETEVQAMHGKDMSDAEFDDFRARVRRLAQILRIAGQ
jgi:hypothetical protein